MYKLLGLVVVVISECVRELSVLEWRDVHRPDE
jgi:hypothetical protein